MAISISVSESDKRSAGRKTKSAKRARGTHAARAAAAYGVRQQTERHGIAMEEWRYLYREHQNGAGVGSGRRTSGSYAGARLGAGYGIEI